MSQPELFQKVLQVTGTSEADWSVERKTTRRLIEDGEKMVEDGDSAGNFKVLFGGFYQHGKGGNYSEKLHNDMLGLKEEDLDEVVEAAIAAAKPGAWEAGSTLAT